MGQANGVLVAGARSVEVAGGGRSRAGASDQQVVVKASDPELVQRALRRRFDAAYKLRVLGEADACTEPGEIGALLRREGLYSSLLSGWRTQRELGALAALEKPRGRPHGDPRDRQISELRRQIERLEGDLATARRVCEVQGNVSALLGELLVPRGANPTTPR